jgi:RimJ/RimL family protein N-acetyltransferase
MTTSSDDFGSTVASHAASEPTRVVLEGRHVRLVPLDAAAHGEALFEATSGPEQERVWLYLFDGPYSNRDEMDAALSKKEASTDAFFFSILDVSTGRALGYASYMRIDPPNRVIEVGNVLFAPALQGTTGATEAMYLMARHAFDSLGYRRYEWKCNALNARSRRAALRLGFTFEGVFRQHMIIKGRNRDTAWYSMLDSEWPNRRAALERWLDPANFDAEGKQRRTLAECRV